jgi:hypothetical protein
MTSLAIRYRVRSFPGIHISVIKSVLLIWSGFRQQVTIRIRPIRPDQIHINLSEMYKPMCRYIFFSRNILLELCRYRSSLPPKKLPPTSNMSVSVFNVHAPLLVIAI